MNGDAAVEGSRCASVPGWRPVMAGAVGCRRTRMGERELRGELSGNGLALCVDEMEGLRGSRSAWL